MPLLLWEELLQDEWHCNGNQARKCKDSIPSSSTFSETVKLGYYLILEL